MHEFISRIIGGTSYVFTCSPPALPAALARGERSCLGAPLHSSPVAVVSRSPFGDFFYLGPSTPPISTPPHRRRRGLLSSRCVPCRGVKLRRFRSAVCCAVRLVLLSSSLAEKTFFVLTFLFLRCYPYGYSERMMMDYCYYYL